MSNQISLSSELCLKIVDLLHQAAHTLQFTRIFRAEQAGEKISHNFECSKNSHCSRS